MRVDPMELAIAAVARADAKNGKLRAVLAEAYKTAQFIHHDSVARKHYQEGLSPEKREYYQGKADAIRQIVIALESDADILQLIRPLAPDADQSWQEAERRARGY